MATDLHDRFEWVEVVSRAQLREWLESHHTQRVSIWLVRYKKGASKPAVDYSDIVDEVLCFGWIDSQVRKLDDERTMLLISPRRPRSGWSRVNKEKVARLIADGLMREPGLAKIEAAKADGSWDSLNDVDALVIPPDLQEALRRHPPARENFGAFSPSSRRGILEWIASARRAETRAKRVEETAALAAQNVKANQPKPRQSGA